MSTTQTVSTVAIGAAVATALVAIGYYAGRRRGLRRNFQTNMMNQKAHGTNNPLVKYMMDHSIRFHPAQEKLIKVTKEHPRAIMLSSPDEMQLLCNLVKTIKARKTIDVGVYTGYSALSIALALPDDGTVVACDISSDFADIGKPYWNEAGVAHKIDLRIAPAMDTLQSLVDRGESGTYDFAFIDADKINYISYYELCMKLVRSGGIIAIDNVLWSGLVIDSENTDTLTNAIRSVNEHVSKDHRANISMINIGDGTTLVFKK